MTPKTGSLFAATVLATCISAPLQAEIYRLIDADGNVVFTDKKPASKEAEIVELEMLNTIPASPKTSAPTIQSNQTQPNQAQPNEPEPSKSGYTSLDFITPDNGEYFHNPEVLEIKVNSKPGLREGDQYRFLLDGKTVGTGTEPEFSIKWPDRGTHMVQVQIVNKGKKVAIETAKHTIFVMRAIKKKQSDTPTAQPANQ